MTTYPCVYCRKSIEHGTQPVTTEAVCWRCWGDRLLESRAALQRQLRSWPYVALMMFVLGLVVGWLT